MKIVIPMAGYGTRLRPHTWSRPKPLLSVAGKAVLGHVLDMFAEVPNIEEVVFIVGYLGEQVEDFMAKHFPEITAQYVLQEQLLGQSHALWLAREHLKGPICMVFVDTLLEVDLSGIPDEKAAAVAWVKQVEDPRRFGVADVGKDGKVRRLIEKPDDVRNNLALAGFYYFEDAEALVQAIEHQMEEGTQLGGEYYLVDAINIMLEAGLDMRVEPVEVWKDCGTPDALLDTNRYLLDNGHDNTVEAALHDTAIIIPPVFIHPTANISGSLVGPYASIGPECVIQQAIVRDAIVEARALVKDCILEESIIGQDARVVGQPRRLQVGDHSSLDIP